MFHIRVGLLRRPMIMLAVALLPAPHLIVFHSVDTAKYVATTISMYLCMHAYECVMCKREQKSEKLLLKSVFYKIKVVDGIN